MSGKLAGTSLLEVSGNSGLRPIFIKHDDVPRDNGESALAEVLDRRRIRYWYESWDFPLEMRLGIGSFKPDFVLRRTRFRPSIILEVTEADSSKNQLAQRALQRKQQQASLVLQLYGISTVIVTSSRLTRIINRWNQLDRMIEHRLRIDSQALRKLA